MRAIEVEVEVKVVVVGRWCSEKGRSRYPASDTQDPQDGGLLGNLPPN